MSDSHQNLLSQKFYRSDFALWEVGTILLIVTLSCEFFALSRVGEKIDRRFIRPLMFSIRENLSMQPQLDPRIKILSLDDKTVSILGKHDLRLNDWATILENIDAKNPKAIIIDRRWSLPIGENFDHPVGKEEGQRFINRIKKLRSKVISGATFFDRKIEYQKPLNINRNIYKIENYLNDPSTDKPDWVPQKTAMIYGPSEHIEEAFPLTGHIHYQEGSQGFIYPFIRINNTSIIPHATFLVADQIRLLEHSFTVNNVSVDINRDSLVAVNFASNNEMAERQKNLFWFIQNLNQKKDNEINEGDIVFVLPLMYTGNNDYVEGPLGRVNGAFILVSLVNSILTEKWIHFHESLLPYLLLISLLGIGAGIYLRGIAFLGAFFATISIICALGIAAFVAYDVESFWFSILLAFTASAFVSHIRKSYLNERKAQKLREALSGTIPSEKIEEIIRNPALLRFEASEKYVTIMFIDIVGFSVIAERLSPGKIFESLKSELQSLTTIIHAHGGIIDKNLGDGLLCFFGFDYTGKEATLNHADAAIHCALEIQRKSAHQAITTSDPNVPIFPVRIGINTATAFIGDVGDARRIDFTLIGQGVNFASRLEGAAEAFRIMLGPETVRNLSENIQLGDSLQKRMVQIKHHEQLLEAYELNPFFEDPERLNQAMAAYRKYMEINRGQQRYRLQTSDSLALSGEFGIAAIVNLSLSGYAIRTNKYLAKGVNQTVDLKAKDPILNRKLHESSLCPFSVEVCWGNYDPRSDAYLLGIRIKSLNNAQRQKLFELCEGLLDTKDIPKAAA